MANQLKNSIQLFLQLAKSKTITKLLPKLAAKEIFLLLFSFSLICSTKITKHLKKIG